MEWVTRVLLIHAGNPLYRLDVAGESSKTITECSHIPPAYAAKITVISNIKGTDCSVDDRSNIWPTTKNLPRVSPEPLITLLLYAVAQNAILPFGRRRRFTHKHTAVMTYLRRVK